MKPARRTDNSRTHNPQKETRRKKAQEKPPLSFSCCWKSCLVEAVPSRSKASSKSQRRQASSRASLPRPTVLFLFESPRKLLFSLRPPPSSKHDLLSLVSMPQPPVHAGSGSSSSRRSTVWRTVSSKPIKKQDGTRRIPSTRIEASLVYFPCFAFLPSSPAPFL